MNQVWSKAPARDPETEMPQKAGICASRKWVRRVHRGTALMHWCVMSWEAADCALFGL